MRWLRFKKNGEAPCLPKGQRGRFPLKGSVPFVSFASSRAYLLTRAERQPDIFSSAHAFDPEALLVRLSAHRQRDEIIAGIGELCSTRGSAERGEAATATAAPAPAARVRLG